MRETTTSVTDGTQAMGWHCQLCGSTDPEDVAGREEGRYYSGCCNEGILDDCDADCDH